MALPKLTEIRIGIIGLDYVGLPLAVYLARHFPVLGFDIDRERVAELSRGIDRTREVTEEEFAHAARITCSADVESLRDANFYIVTVPTPVDQAKRPDPSWDRCSGEAMWRSMSRLSIPDQPKKSACPSSRKRQDLRLTAI